MSVRNSLIDMYGKHGSVGSAHQVFEEMAEQDVVSWNVMIAGLAQHGCSKDALELFEQVKRGGFTPNTVTFVGLLSACSHTGLVDEGCEFFLPMCGDYSSRRQLGTMAVWLIYLGVLGSWMTLKSSSTKCHCMQIHQSGTVCSVLAEFMATYS